MAGMLAAVVLLSACPDGRGPAQGGPRLPEGALPSTTVGLDYEAVFTASGGLPPLRYTLTPPPGFSFYLGEGRLTGQSTEAGDFALTVSVTDANGEEDTRTYPLKVWPFLEVVRATLPPAIAGASYEQVLAAAGGGPPLRWSLTEGSLPTGVSLSDDGVLTGLPQEQGIHPLTLRVQDANGATSEARMELVVLGPDSQSDGGPAPSTFPLSVANWNIEWFGDTQYGPSDETLQLTNAQAVIADAGVDFWGLAEIVDTAHFNALKARLPGYDGFLANDASRVSSGSSQYSSSDQKVGVLFKSDVVQVLRADVVLTNYRYEFGTRPPLRVDLRVKRGDTTVDVTAFVIHMKSATSPTDYARRAVAARQLKAYLDLNLPTQRALVVGDWNDDVDMSIVTGTDPSTGKPYETPYRNFVDDPDNYMFTTQALSQAGVGSTASRNTFLDHQLVTNELWADYVTNSTTVLRPNISQYRYTTSDHYPIISRFNLGQHFGSGIGGTTAQTDDIPGAPPPAPDSRGVEAAP
ncbi:endonuclease/exonuclease/phosphatase family protein [Corallococcus silvisoli]|uniref:endonuclease/exonuclease/phosphatase family protein n=1 Tax=Corallococcus silvisoli TaxID=2697031 RepID=UPI00191BFF12|nr:putative Ig domain-containing protein [Corallococcus silvisoli]